MCTIFVIFAIAFVQAQRAEAAIPPGLITYQGKLLDNGSLATTTKSATFTLHDALTGGNTLHTTATSVVPSDGLFSIDISATSTIFRDNSAVYLQVQIDGETLSPRKRITASPYSFNSRYLDGVAPDTVSTSQYIPLSDTNGFFTFTSATITTATVSNLTVSGQMTMSNVSTTNLTVSGNLAVSGTTTLATTTITSSTITNLIVGTSIQLPNDSIDVDAMAPNSVGSSELISSGVVAEIYGSSTHSGRITVDEDGRITSASSQLISINANQVSAGILATARGGTGTSTLGSNGSMVYSNGTTYSFVSPGTSGQILLSNGAASPSWTNTSTLGLAAASHDHDSAYVNVSGDIMTGALSINNTLGVSGTTTLATSSGRVGIGTTSPSSSLHINEGGLLITGTTGATPVSGAGTRLMWIPAKSAFRAGIVTGAQWDDANIGNYSMAFGYDSMATGTQTYAFGSEAVAGGEASYAFGPNAVVNGAGSFAIGQSANVTGYNSYAIGREGTVNGNYSQLFTLNSAGHTLSDSNTLSIMGGEVGIGTTTPIAELDIYGNIALTGGSPRYINFNTSTGSDGYGLRDNSGTMQYKNLSGSWLNLSNAGSYWTLNGSDIYYNNGNVGIGTTTPSYLLDVAGDVRIGTSTSSTIIIRGLVGSDIIPTTDATYALGSSALRWSNVYSATGTFGNSTIIGTNSITADTDSLWSTTNSSNLSIMSSANLTISSQGEMMFGTQGSEKMRIASSTGYVGINNTDPQQLLHISGVTPAILVQTTNSTTDSSINFADTEGGDTWQIGKKGSNDGGVNNYLFFSYAGEKVVVNPDGQMGIGTLAPQTLLHLSEEDGGGADSSAPLTLLTLTHTAASTSSAGIGAQINFELEHEGGATVTGAAITGELSDASSTVPLGALLFKTNDANPMLGLQERARINSNGYMGIGTDDPGARLQIENQDVSNAQLRISQNASNYVDFKMSTTSLYINTSVPTTTLNSVYFYLTNNTNTSTLVIESNVDSGPFGSEIRLIDNHSEGWRIFSDSQDHHLFFRNQNQTVTTTLFLDNNTGYVGIGAASASSSLFVNGLAGGTDTWYSSSDMRLKTNVVSIENALEKVKQLRGVQFDWIDDTNRSKGKQIGFIAQETLPIVPEVVNQIGDMYSIKYGALTALLAEAIKEQQIKIEQLEGMLTLNASSTSVGPISYIGDNINLNGNIILNTGGIIGFNNAWQIDTSGNLIRRLATNKGVKEVYGLQSTSKSEIVISGTSQLQGGQKKIKLDDLDVEIIDTSIPLKVSITMAGPSEGVYVSERSFTDFLVKENNEGKSNAQFDWVVIAKVRSDLSPQNELDDYIPDNINQAPDTNANTVQNSEANQSNEDNTTTEDTIDNTEDTTDTLDDTISEATDTQTDDTGDQTSDQTNEGQTENTTGNENSASQAQTAGIDPISSENTSQTSNTTGSETSTAVDNSGSAAGSTSSGAPNNTAVQSNSENTSQSENQSAIENNTSQTAGQTVE
ncbi:MAG: tail fiber domain-containing protein [bacterium]